MKGNFIDNLKSFAIGGLLRRAERKHNEIYQQVLETGKKGQLTIKLTYKPKGVNEIKVESEVTAKIPERNLDSVSMYADHRGMFEENPDQINFHNVKRIDDKTKKVKQVVS